MRTDLTTAFQTAMAADGRAPVQLLCFYFASGPVYVSDRPLGAADGLANDYAALVEDWGALEDIAADDPGELSAEIRQMTLTLWNGGSPSFSQHFLKEDPENISVDLWQWFTGLDDGDRALIDRFLIADPIQFDERGRLLRLDLVSVAVNFDQLAGGLLTAADWPTARIADVGKPIDIWAGAPGRVPTLCAKTPPATTLAGSILANSMTVNVNDDLDALGFSAAGVLQIGEELLRYGSRTASAFAIIQRGYLSTAAEHLDRDACVEKIDDHTYLIGRGPLGAVGAVTVGGFAAPPSIYSIDLGSDPARVVFTEKPYAYHFAAGSTFLAMQFDTIGADNSAVQPHLAYDAASDATAARIDKDHRRLALKQTTVNPDRGAIVKAYLAVEHWESNAFASDYGEVWVEGVGVVGRLSRPNPADTIDIEAEVDIDHGHTHHIGGEHTHNFHDPILATSETPHSHLANTGGSTDTYTADGGVTSLTVLAPMGYGEVNLAYYKNVAFSAAPNNWDGARLKLTKGGTAVLRVYVPGVISPYIVPDGERTVVIDKRVADHPFGVTFVGVGTGAAGNHVTIDDLRLEVDIDLVIDATVAGVQAQIAGSGANDTTPSDKKSDDVDDLATANAAIQVTATESATRSHVNLFDITSNVNFNWAWFNDRDIRVTYQGSADDRRIYILHCFFDVEYRKRERTYQDDVAVEITSGLIDDASGSVTGSAGAPITRADHVARYLLTVCGGLDPARIHTSSFTAAAARLAAKGYSVNGRISGDVSIKDNLKKVLYQNRLRLFWNAGLAKLAFVEALADWPLGREIAADDYQLNSVAVERQPARAIVNTVSVFYQRDYTSAADGPAAFGQTATAAHAQSVAKHGARRDDARFQFDLVASAAQAEDLALFFADRYAWPSNYIRVNCYLPQFDMEKEDKVNLTADFHRLKKAKARIIGASRIFGSGKQSSINHIQFLAECLRYILIEHTIEDAVTISDALTVSLGFDVNLADVVALTGDLRASMGAALEDGVTIADALTMTADFRPTVADTVTIGDAVGLTIGVNLTDTVTVLDDALAWRTFGFGGGEFGGSGFGGQVLWSNRHPDTLQVSDQLFIDLQPAAITDTVSVADSLYFSCGFGCLLGSGFGVGPFGD